MKKPPIIIDWSGLLNPKFYLLRAALPIQGRSLTLYEEVHPQKNRVIPNTSSIFKHLETVVIHGL